MKTRNLIMLAILVLVFGAVGGWWWQTQAQAASQGSIFEATGTIEVHKVRIVPEIGGKIVQVKVDEGQSVNAGQVLIRFDEAALDSQLDQAQAGLQAARANLALLEAGPTQEQVQAAQAALAQAEASIRAREDSLSTATAGTPPEQLAALRTTLARARDHYRSIRITLTNDQLEALRVPQTSAGGNLSAATERLYELEKDDRNPDFIIASAESAVADAQTTFDAAREAYQAAKDEARPYYLQNELARESLQVSQANLSMAEARHNSLEDESRSTKDGVAAANHAHEEAQNQVGAAQDALEALTNGVDAPHLVAAWDEVQQAQAELAATATANQGSAGVATTIEALLDQVDAAKAARDVAAANLASVENGARKEQLDVAQAQVQAAQAQVDALQVQLDKLTITAPADGVVLARSVEPGEVALPGSLLLEIGRLDSPELTVYLPAHQLVKVAAGQVVNVNVDAYPQRSFSGTILHLADEAEFTPTNVQTKADRAQLVYAVKIRLDNPDLALKPGMYADVQFKP